LRRAPLAGAVAAHDPAPLLARARRQLAAGAHALDLNAGRGDAGSAHALRWSAQLLRDDGITVPFFLDCGDATVLAEVLLDPPPGPLVANAVALGADNDAAMHALLAACARAGAGVVFSPRAADAADSFEAVHAAYVTAQHLVPAYGIEQHCFFDCLAYPPAHDGARCLRSLQWLRALCAHADSSTTITPLVAVGNVGFGIDIPVRAHLRRAYAACAVGAGAQALIAPVEDARLRAAVAVASGLRPPKDEREHWWLALARAARSGASLPPPTAGDALAQTVHALLRGDADR
jgi:cobalamin-dependent methionine synthase I